MLCSVVEPRWHFKVFGHWDEEKQEPSGAQVGSCHAKSMPTLWNFV